MVGISGIELLGLKPVQSRVRSRRMLLGRIASVLRYALSNLGKRVCQIMPLISMVLTDKHDSNEAAARLWTITFFYRVVDTVPSDSKSVLNVEPIVITSGNIISGYIVGLTWLVGVVATRNIAGTFLLSFLSTYPQVFYRYFLTGL